LKDALDYLGPGGFAWNHYGSLIRNKKEKNKKKKKSEKFDERGLTYNLQAA
jgi:hypothetical protein